jgi:hypothetical protein
MDQSPFCVFCSIPPFSKFSAELFHFALMPPRDCVASMLRAFIMARPSLKKPDLRQLAAYYGQKGLFTAFRREKT